LVLDARLAIKAWKLQTPLLEKKKITFHTLKNLDQLKNLFVAIAIKKVVCNKPV